MKKKGGVRRVTSHSEGALLWGLMFPGPFQFFHPGTQRETRLHENNVHDLKNKLINTHAGRTAPSSGTSARLWRETLVRIELNLWVVIAQKQKQYYVTLLNHLLLTNIWLQDQKMDVKPTFRISFIWWYSCFHTVNSVEHSTSCIRSPHL